LAFNAVMLCCMKRVERIRLYPTASQAARLSFMLHATRHLYNALLQERRDAYRYRGIALTAKVQYAELTALRHEDPGIATVYRECQDAVLHRLDLAFAAFFRRVKCGETPGYPRFKAASRWEQLSFPHGDRALKLDAGQRRIRVPGVGSVALRKGRTVPAFGRAWLVRRNDRWYACFECERAVRPLPRNERLVGIDRGVHVIAALDDGTLIRNIAIGELRRSATTRLQRELDAATVKDANGHVLNRTDPARIAAAKRLARSRERERCARLDFLHTVARRIVTAAGTIALEALNLRAMTRSAKGTLEQPGRNVAAKAGLNRRILDASFGRLHRLIVEKAEEAARTVVLVDPKFSSQTCAQCGHVAKESRRRRRFRCVGCGYANHADVNAALVIRGRAQLALLREPHAGQQPVTLQDVA
jgi:putative transposase